jgi:hypothetical protein
LQTSTTPLSLPLALTTFRLIHHSTSEFRPWVRFCVGYEPTSMLFTAPCWSWSADGALRVNGDDLGWHDAFVGTSRIAHLICHGIYVVAPAGVTRVRPDTLNAA